MRHLVITAAILSLAMPALAHKEDYIGETLVFMTLTRRAIEPELWFDSGRDGFRRYSAAVEYGITDRWMSDARVSWARGEPGIDSARVESRYRFGDEGTRPIDIAAPAEVNMERDESGKRRYGFEPRLILSKDFRKLNLTLNLSEEIRSGKAHLVTASGLRYDATQLFRAGMEVQYDTDERRGTVIPQLWFTLPHDITIKGGYARGFRQASDRFARIAVEFEF